MVGKRVAIVGAGLAGLSAGLELKDAGCTVDVFERSRLLGGRATSFEVGGREVDNGQHVFLNCCTAFVEFASRVGMGDKLHVQPRFDARIIGRSGVQSRLRAANLPAPLHLLASFAAYRHLSIGGRVRVARALASAKREADPRDRTFDQWLRRNGQTAETIAAFWEPFFVPAVNASLERVSTEDALFVLRTAFLGDARAACFGFSSVPLAHLAQAAARRLDDVRVQTAVTDIAVNSDGVRLELAGSERVDYDAAVLATAPPGLARLLGDGSAFGVAGIDQFEAFPIIDVHLWHDGGPLGFDFAALLESPVQWIFEKAPGYLCASMSAAGDYSTRSTDDLVQTAWREASSAIASLKGARLIEQSVTRNPYATYLPPLGASRPGQRTSHANLTIAGSWTQTGWPDTMEAAVRSGVAAAKLLLQNVATKRTSNVVQIEEPSSEVYSGNRGAR